MGTLKFLVIQQKMIGDVLASTVICESLKYHFPDAIVHLVANENTLPVLQNNPYIDKVILFKKEYRESKTAFYRFLKSLKRTDYTAVVDAYGKLESNLISLFAKGENKIALYKWYTSWIYTHTVKQPRTTDGNVPLSISDRLLLLDPIISENTFITYPKLYLSEKEMKMGKDTVAKLKDHGAQKVIMISILGSSTYKTYPKIYMANVLDNICKHCNAKLVFNYIPEQRESALEIYRLCYESTQKAIDIDFYANSLRNFIAVLSQCDLLVGNEGGAANMAKALDVPTFSIFSPFILKEAWLGKLYKNHYGVHLRDYRPNLYQGMTKKQIKKNSLVLYEAFEPGLFEKPLLEFLDRYLINHPPFNTTV